MRECFGHLLTNPSGRMGFVHNLKIGKEVTEPPFTWLSLRGGPITFSTFVFLAKPRMEGYFFLKKKFFDVSTQEGGGGIRTSDLHFIKRGPSRLSYLLGTDGRLLARNGGRV
jgi:hypothetical protein